MKFILRDLIFAFVWALAITRSNGEPVKNVRNALTFDRHIGNSATKVPVKFQSDQASLNTNLAA